MTHLYTHETLYDVMRAMRKQRHAHLLNDDAFDFVARMCDAIEYAFATLYAHETRSSIDDAYDIIDECE